MTPEELYDYIANKHKGIEYNKNLIALNARGMATEWITLQAEKQVLLNALRESEVALEKQWAAYLSIKNKSQEMLNAEMAQGIRARVSPDMLSVKLEKQGEEYVVADGVQLPSFTIPDDLQGMMKAVLVKVAANESKGSYNAWNNYPCKSAYSKQGPWKGQIEYDFTKRTISQVLALRPNGCRIYAVGKYQVIPSTMDMAVKALKIHPNTTLYSPEVQEQIGMYLLLKKQPNLKNWFAGKATLRQAQIALAGEWRSVGDPRYCNHTTKTCKPYGGGTVDKADYEHTMQVWAILAKMDEYMKNNPNSRPF